MASTCKHLEQWIKDPRNPYRYDQATNRFVLELAPGVSVENAICSFCGGRGFPDSGWKYALTRRCHCGAVKRWAADPNVPVEFDRELNEYSILVEFGQGGKLRQSVKYCPVCGGRGPLPHRGDRYTEPSAKEELEIEARLKSCNDFDEIIAALGAPDDETGPVEFSQEDKEVYGLQDSTRSATWNRLGRRTVLYVNELADGTLRTMFSGQCKPERTIGDRFRRIGRRVWDAVM